MLLARAACVRCNRTNFPLLSAFLIHPPTTTRESLFGSTISTNLSCSRQLRAEQSLAGNKAKASLNKPQLELSLAQLSTNFFLFLLLLLSPAVTFLPEGVIRVLSHKANKIWVKKSAQNCLNWRC
jgi:hypothetical protein